MLELFKCFDTGMSFVVLLKPVNHATWTHIIAYRFKEGNGAKNIKWELEWGRYLEDQKYIDTPYKHELLIEIIATLKKFKI